jgi:ankyrin repeat protein
VGPVFLAAQSGHSEVMRWLLAAGSDVNQAREHDGATPLFMACQDGHAETVGLLLGAGARAFDMTYDDGTSPLFMAAQEGHAAVVGLLVDQGKPAVDVDQGRVTDGLHPLYIAASEGRLESCRRLLEGGADVDRRSVSGWTALFTAAFHGELACAELLLGHGAARAVQATGDYLGLRSGCTALIVAEHEGHDDVAFVIDAPERRWSCGEWR